MSRRFRTWVLLVVGVPIVAWALEKAADTVEGRRGETSLTRGLRGGGYWLRRRTPGGRRREGPSTP